jgi:dihydroflavonol-4-reductase
MDFEQLRGKKVLVTGATGFTGSVLLKKLLDLGADVTAIRRSSSKVPELAGVKWVVGNVYDQQAIKQATPGIEYVFHVAAAFREAKIQDIEYHRVHVESTKLLAEELVGKPQFCRFVHVSTMGVHGHIENPPGNEESPYAPGDAYQITKLEADLWIREFSKQHNFPIIRIQTKPSRW